MSSTRPNILLIMSDEHAPQCSSVYGHPLVRTPHLQRLASEGVTFDAAYCNAPICVPSRASFMTGKHVHRIGAWDNWTPFSSDTVTWAHLLRAAGYRVLLDGKMHFVGPDTLHGFERQLTRDSSSRIDAFPRGEQIGEDEIARFRRRVEEAGQGHSKHVDFDENVTAAAINWLHAQADGGEPWCLVASLLTPHFPLIAPEEYYSQYSPHHVDMPAVPPAGDDVVHPAHARMRHFFGLDGLTDEQIHRARAAYYGLVTYTDTKVGQLLAALAETGFAENTLVVYTADHGEMAGEHGLWWKNSFYEESARVPLIVRWPARLAENTRFGGVVSLVDVARTLVDVAGAEDPGDLDGDSLLGVLQAGAGEPDDVRSRWKDEAFSEYYGPATDRPHRMLRRGRWKYCYYHDEPGELYDLQTDPHERCNLAEEPACAAIAGSLRRHLLAGWDPVPLAATVRESMRARRYVAASRPPGE
ncbi:MAG: sulfatase-like hydrolase/transferase [Chloroflexota bacterium]